MRVRRLQEKAFQTLPNSNFPKISITLIASAATATTEFTKAQQDMDLGLEADADNEGDKPQKQKHGRRHSMGGAPSQGSQSRCGRKSDRRHGPNAKFSRTATAPSAFLAIDQEADGNSSEAEMSGVDDYYRSKSSSRSADVDLGAASAASSRGSRTPVSRKRGLVRILATAATECAIGGKPEIFDTTWNQKLGM